MGDSIRCFYRVPVEHTVTVNQLAHDSRVAVVGGFPQRRRPRKVLKVGIRASAQKLGNNFAVAPFCCEQQGCASFVVADRLSVPATGAQASEPEDEERLSPQTEPFNLERFVEDAAVATSQGGSSPGPGRGFLRDLRVRVLMSRDGQLAVECTVMGADRPLSTLTRAVDMYTSCPFAATVPGEGEQRGAATPPCHVTVDAQPTRTSLFTRHKTTHRAPYDDARARAGSPPLLPTTSPTAREVLLSNAAGQVTEASLSAVYFLRGGAWLTPRSDCGGLQSVTRLYALEAGWCDEGIVPVHEVAEGEVVWLSNAVRGFFPGVVKLHGQNGRENST
ncbi:hypothetical protein CLAIMM_08066 isoform 2 [Cladophialophora immunda]|nr:hypothetical protein CLAIMM_08066 isoform 2 [Cladophialophora immunda]